eukprot:5485948-Pleurochrysis_carterae.AAC.1
MAQVEMDENPATGAQILTALKLCPQNVNERLRAECACMSLAGAVTLSYDPSDEFMVSWWGVYDVKKDYPIITNKVDGTWMRRCKHAFDSSKRWGHALKDDAA